MAENQPQVYEFIPAGESEEPTEEELAFSAFKDEYSESDTYAKFTVYRQPTGPYSRPGSKKLSFLFECGVDDFSYSQLLSKLRDEYGSGTYRIQGRDATGKLLFNRTVEVETPKVQPGYGAQQESPTQMFKTFEEIVNAQQQRFEQLLARLQPRGQEAQNKNPMQEMIIMFGMFTEMQKALSGNVSKAPDVLSEVERLKALRDLLGSFNDGGGSASGAESNFYDLAGKALDNLGPLFAMAGKLAPNAMPQLSPPQKSPQHQQSQAQPQSQPGANPAMSAEMQELKNRVDILVSNAQKGVDPVKMASVILNLTPDEKLEDLKNFLSDPECVTKMAQVNPEVTTYQGWFASLKAAVLNELQEDTDGANVET